MKGEPGASVPVSFWSIPRSGNVGQGAETSVCKLTEHIFQSPAHSGARLPLQHGFTVLISLTCLVTF